MITVDCDVSNAKKWFGLAALLVVNFLAVLASTIVTVAIPSIRAEWGLSSATTVWVLGAYALCYGIVLVPGGRWGDVAGRKRAFLLGMVVFCVGGVVAACAPTGVVLIIGAAVQGCAAGLAVPQVLGSIPTLFPPQERGRAFGLYGLATGLGAAVGPLVGGLLLAWNPAGLSWRGIYIFLVLIGLTAFVVSVRALPALPGRGGSIDLVGALLLMVGLLVALIPLTLSQQGGWTLGGILTLCSGVPVFFLFAAWQRVTQVRGKEPLLHLALLRQRGFIAALLVGLCYFAAFQGMLFVVATGLQSGWKLTPLSAGLCLTPFAVASMVVSLGSDRITRRLGRGAIIVGTVLAIVGLGAAALAAAVSLGPIAIACALIVVGLGHGMIVPPNVALGLRTVPVGLAGGAGGAVNTAQRLGQTTGVAVIGGVFLSLAPLHGYPLATAIALVIALGAGVIALMAAFILPRVQ